MKPGVTVHAALADLKLIAARLTKQYRDSNDKVGASVTALDEDIVGNSSAWKCTNFRGGRVSAPRRRIEFYAVCAACACCCIMAAMRSSICLVRWGTIPIIRSATISCARWCISCSLAESNISKRVLGA